MKRILPLILLLTLSAADAQTTQPSEFFRRITVEDFQRVGRRNARWDADALQVVDAFSRVLGMEFRPQGDEFDVIFSQSRKAHEAGCSDPQVIFAMARSFTSFSRKYEDTVVLYLESSRRMHESSYHPLLKCMVSLQAAVLRGRDRTDPRTAHRDGRRMINIANEALPKVLADPDVPFDSVLSLFEQIGDASAIVERDRSMVFSQAMTLLEQARPNSAVIPAARAQFHLDHSRDARRDTTVPPEQIEKLVGERLAKALAEGEKAWALDPKQPRIAMIMMNIHAAHGSTAEVDTWFDRANAAEPDSYAAHALRLGQLAGNLPQMIEFARSCAKKGKPESGLPMLLVEAHLRAACYVDGVEQRRAAAGLLLFQRGSGRTSAPSTSLF